jgi:tRNA (guanine26-N2/guanine27-N2)-dimethyltransferase
MYNHREPGQQFDVVDLDPYGSAAPFLDAAVQAVADGGLLCVTCTDMPVLSGNYPETSFAKYGTFPVKAKYHHEVALRTLLNAIETSANRYKKHIVPWISCAIDFYVRVFVRVFVSPNEVKKSCMKRAYVHQSKQCASYFMQPMVNPVSKEKGVDPLNPNNNNLLFYAAAIEAPAVCPETGSKMKIGGPFYAAAMHDKAVVEAILESIEPRKKGKVPESVTVGPLDDCIDLQLFT